VAEIFGGETVNRSVIRALFVALSICLFSLDAHAKEEELRRLMAEASDFQAEYRKATRKHAQIEAAEQDFSGRRLALKNATESLRDRRPRPCPQEGANKGVEVSCNAETAKLDSWKNELLGQAGGTERYAERLQQEQERSNQAAALWADKKKSNTALLNVLDIAFQSWRRRFTDLAFKSAPYNRLVSTEEGAANCQPLPSSDRDAILESAQRCLQWLWIGEMQNRSSSEEGKK
jgi:hypothetical protein